MLPKILYANFDNYSFMFANEFAGSEAYTNPDVTKNMQQWMANGFGFWPPLSDPVKQLLQTNNVGLVFFLPAATSVVSTYPGSLPQFANQIESQKVQVQSLTNIMGEKIWWNTMPEWDQSGGSWSTGRPRNISDRISYYNAFKNFYFNLSPLGNYLRQTRVQRGFNMLAVTDYPQNSHYAYEWGLDCVLLERNIDELGDIQTGVSFIRGAARQYDRCWGVDISEWKTSSDSPTQYNDSLQMTGGWSTSYHKRHLYISYMSGSHNIHLEPITYYNAGKLNPFGQTVKEFGNFSLVRHKDIGKTVVPMALMLDFYNGFDPKHGRYNQANGVWYQDIPYSDGDFMTHNLFNTFFPDYWKTGTSPNAPWSTPEQFRQMVTNGLDPRPYEPMSNSKWGDHLDIILNNASLDTLKKYKIIMIGGTMTFSSTLRANITQWVQDGGTLIINTKQVTPEDQSLTGVTFTSTTRQSTNSTWIPDNTNYTESAYSYTFITPTTATVIAKNSANDPVVTKNTLGNGNVYLTTPSYLQDTGKTKLLSIGQKLIDTLLPPLLPARVVGPDSEYIINEGSNKTIVTIVNNSGNTWQGSILFNKFGNTYTTRDWSNDTQISNTLTNGKISIAAQVPAYDLKIYAVEYSGPITSPTQTIKIGDANNDNKVDGVDYLAWLNHYNQNTTNGARDGDFNNSGKVDGADYVAWLSNYGK